MSTSKPRPTFDPVAAMKAADEADTETLEALDKEVTLLAGQVMNLARDVFYRDADDDDPVRKQIETARQARDDLQAMLDAFNGGTSTSTLSAEKQALLDLIDSGEIRVFQKEDPDAQGTMVYAFRDTRRRLYRSQSQATTSSQEGSATPAAPPAQSSNQTTQQTAASAAPAQNPAPATPPQPAPAGPAPAATNPTQPAPAAPATGSPPPPAAAPAAKKNRVPKFVRDLFQPDES